MENKVNLICPRCGAQMNHHSDKMVFASDRPEPALPNEVILESHECPNCGKCVTNIVHIQT